MKFEDKILILLSEYPLKTDGLLVRMEKTDKQAEQTNRNVEIMSKALVDHSLKFNKISEDIKKINEDNKKISEDNKVIMDDIKRLGEETKKLREDQGVVLKELLSISRRVSNLEDSK